MKKKENFFVDSAVRLVELLTTFAIFVIIFALAGWVMRKTDTSVVSLNLVNNQGECAIMGTMVPKPLIEVDVIKDGGKKDEPQN